MLLVEPEASRMGWGKRRMVHRMILVKHLRVLLQIGEKSRRGKCVFECESENRINGVGDTTS